MAESKNSEFKILTNQSSEFSFFVSTNQKLVILYFRFHIKKSKSLATRLSLYPLMKVSLTSNDPK